MVARSVVDLFDNAVTDGLTTGWQVYASSPSGGVLSLAGGGDGLGEPVLPTTLFRPYCAMKPLLAIVIGWLIDAGEVSLDDELGNVIDVSPGMRSISIHQLLTHRSGVCRPSAMDVSAMVPSQRLSAVAEGPTCAVPLGPKETLYTEAAAWILLGAVAQELLGQDLVSCARSRILAPLDLQDEFDLSDLVDSDRLGLNIALRNGRDWPLLMERTEILGWRQNPGYGGAATMCGLAGLLREILDARAGDGRVLSTVTAQQMSMPCAVGHDRTLGMKMSYGLGLMLDLAEMDFGPTISRDAFGHSGLTGMTAIWADPSDQLVAGYHINGLTDGPTAVTWMRPRMVSAISNAVRSRS